MKQLACLLDRLALTPSQNGKMRLLQDYFTHSPDPDRGYGLAILTGNLTFGRIKPAVLRAMMSEQMDDVLFALSLDYVGDLAETIALTWDPMRRSAPAARVRIASPVVDFQGEGELCLSSLVQQLQQLGRTGANSQLPKWLDQLNATARHALLKLLTSGLQPVVSTRDAQHALADLGDMNVSEIEELWHGLQPPYEDLFAWLTGNGSKPAQLSAAPFRSFMLANTFSPTDREELDPTHYVAEWKWDGLRVQATNEGGTKRLYTRFGEDISHAFPDILDTMAFEGSLEGELLAGKLNAKGVVEEGRFSDLQQRLGRKRVSKTLLSSCPIFIRVNDLLVDKVQDLRQLPYRDRRQRLKNLISTMNQPLFDLSTLLDFQSWEDLDMMRKEPPHPTIEGLMIRQQHSVYQPGQPSDHWYKWLREPMRIDGVLMYAQRGRGKHSSYYSDVTLGVWTDEQILVPVCKVSCGWLDEQLAGVDKFVRDNTIERFGPVRSVVAKQGAGLVIEIIFGGVDISKRRKSGLILRSPHIAGLRLDKNPGEADTLATLQSLRS